MNINLAQTIPKISASDIFERNSDREIIELLFFNAVNKKFRKVLRNDLNTKSLLRYLRQFLSKKLLEFEGKRKKNKPRTGFLEALDRFATYLNLTMSTTDLNLD
jgi:hypothetical protein